ncbi:MAG: LamG domain-containing protein [Alphaproteobacteria bacterium]
MAYDFLGTGGNGPGGSSKGALVYQNQTHYRSITAFTVAGWVNIDEWGDGAVWTTWEWGGGNRGFLFWVDPVAFFSGRTNAITWALSNANGGNFQLESATNALSTSVGWQHVAASYKADDVSGARLYVDGIEDNNSPASTVGILDSGVEPRLVAIGDEGHATNARSLNGQLAEIATWNRVLEPDEIAALAKGFSPLCFPQAMMDYWPLVADTNARITGETATVYGTVTKTDHPPIFMPHASHVGMPVAQTMDLSSALAARHGAALAPDTVLAPAASLAATPMVDFPAQISARDQITLRAGSRGRCGTVQVEAGADLAHILDFTAVGGSLIELALSLALRPGDDISFGRGFDGQVSFSTAPAVQNLATVELEPAMSLAAAQALKSAAGIAHWDQIALAATLGEAVASALVNPGQLVTVKVRNQTITVEAGEQAVGGNQIIRIDSV